MRDTPSRDFPFGRARLMGGGQIMVFAYYPTEQDACDAIVTKSSVRQFVIEVKFD